MKTLVGMNWALSNLQDDDFYSSDDDNMIVNLGQLQENIDKCSNEKSNNKWPECLIIFGYEVRIGGIPKLSRISKNPITIKDNKNFVVDACAQPALA